VKLDANESPYGLKLLKAVYTNRYPDPEAKELRNLIARKFRIKADNILHGNGSDELIYYLITTFSGPVVYPVPTFSMYGIIARALGEKNIELPLDKAFDLNTGDFLLRMKKMSRGLIFLSSPNNPTGNSFSPDRIMKIINRTKGLVVVDEAYQPFSDKSSFLPLIREHKNLIVLRTFSKVGLAALRVGFMVAHPGIIKEVNKVRLPFNLNTVSQYITVKALKEDTLTKKYAQAVIRERKRLFAELDKIRDITPYPSDANFILFRASGADKLYKGLIEKGVLIRNMKGVLDDCLRVTVGRPGENSVFLKTLRQLV
jgi:histidinol-phosphate aminotransferase